MNEAQKKELKNLQEQLIELDKKYDEYKNFLDEYSQVIEAAYKLTEGKEEFTFFDSEGTVFLVEENPSLWHSTKYNPIVLSRSRRNDERAGRNMTIARAKELKEKFSKE